jgi:aryl-alcohol dehydrogenase-like predicted oxidoreductase
MRTRTFGKTGWTVGEVGYGMWGMASWSGSSDDESLASLEHAVDLGCTFLDTAPAGVSLSEPQVKRSDPGFS